MPSFPCLSLIEFRELCKRIMIKFATQRSFSCLPPGEALQSFWYGWPSQQAFEAERPEHPELFFHHLN